MSRLLKITTSLFILSALYILNPPSTFAATTIGTHLAEGDIQAQIDIIDMLISKGATKDHPLTGMAPLGTSTSQINSLCSAMTQLTDTPVLRIIGLTLQASQLSQVGSTANNLNASSCPDGSIVVFGNELNRLDVELSGFTSVSAAGIAYNTHFSTFKSSLSSRFQLAASPLDVYNATYLATDFASVTNNSYGQTNIAACNEYDTPPHNLNACGFFQKMTSTTGLPQFRTEYGPDIFTAKIPGDYIAFYKNNIPSSKATALIENDCGSGWLYYVDEANGGAGGIYTFSGAEVTSDCQAGKIRTKFYLPEDITKIKSSYQVMCASPLDTTIDASGDESACGNNLIDKIFGCSSTFTEDEVQVDYQLDSQDSPWPWIDRPRDTRAKLRTAEDKSESSVPAFFNFKSSNPNDAKELTTPIYTGTRKQQQFDEIKKYAQNTLDGSQSFKQVTGEPKSAFPLFRNFKDAFPGKALYQRFPYITEYEFFKDVVVNLAFDGLGSLSTDFQEAFWDIVPHPPEGAVCETGYLVSYTSDPIGSKFNFTQSDSLLKITRNCVPFTYAQQANQNRQSAELGQELASPDILFKSFYQDSASRNTARLLKRKHELDAEDQQAQVRRASQFNSVNNASLDGPIINIPSDIRQLASEDVTDAKVVVAISQLINQSGVVCDGVPSGEIADRTNINSELGVTGKPGFFSLQFITGNILQKIASIIKPFSDGANTAKISNYLVVPETVLLAQKDALDNLTPSFYRRADFEKLKPTLATSYQTTTNDLSAANATRKFPPGPTEDDPDPPTYTVSLGTDVSGKLKTAFIGNLNVFLNRMSNLTRRFKDPTSLNNSGWQGKNNESEGYWHQKSRRRANLDSDQACTLANSGIKSTQVQQVIADAASWANVPTDVLITVIRNEGGCDTSPDDPNRICTVDDDEVGIKNYLAEGVEFPANGNNCPGGGAISDMNPDNPSISKGPLQIYHNPVNWGTWENAVNLATKDNRQTNICNVKDSIYAAALSLSAGKDGCPSASENKLPASASSDWSPEDIQNALTSWALGCGVEPCAEGTIAQTYCGLYDDLKSQISASCNPPASQ